jgi:hypothetical protein
LFKKQQKQRPHGTTVSSTVQTLLYNIKKSHQFTSSLPYEKKIKGKKIREKKQI